MNASMILSFDRDISDPLITFCPATLLARGDRNANIIKLTVMDGNAPADLSGNTAVVLFQRPGDSYVVRCPGSVSGNVISVTLLGDCYIYAGQYYASLILDANGFTRTMLRLAGHIESNGDGPIIDPTGTIPGYEDIARIYAELEASLGRSDAATDSANTAAQNANKKAALANEAAGNANEAADSADEATIRANEASESIEGLTVEASDVSYDQPATATVTDVEGHKHIAFGLRQGVPGPVPKLTFTGETGEPNTDVVITQSGPPEAPVVNLKIPQGVPGTGNVSTVDGVGSDAGGNVALSAVRYVAQTLEDAQKVQARKNIGVDGQVYPCTASALEALSSSDLVGIYNQGYRAVQATNNETVVTLGLAADGSLSWQGCNQDRTNLLDNPNFAIAQAGYGGAHGTQKYAADRWLIYNSPGADLSVSWVGNGIKLSSTGGGSTISQRFPANSLKSLGDLTCVFYTDSGPIFREIGQHVDIVDYVDFLIESEHEVTVYGAAIYKGSYTSKTLPPWEEPNFMTELNKCLYYFRIGGDPGAVTKVSDGILSVYGGLGAPMRVPPTLVLRVETIDLYSGQDLVFTPNGEITASTTEHAIKFANIPGTFSLPVPDGFIKMNSAGIFYEISDI